MKSRFVFLCSVGLLLASFGALHHPDSLASASLSTSVVLYDSSTSVRAAHQGPVQAEVSPAPEVQRKPRVEPDAVTVTVYVTRTGAKYHRDGCRYLARSRIPMELSEAASRYDPCTVCNPPVRKSAADVAAPKNSVQSAQARNPEEVIVYVTRTGSKYHRAGCRYLARSSIRVSLNEAARRYGPCAVCKPPVSNR
jgi:hypothetical protein